MNHQGRAVLAQTDFPSPEDVLAGNRLSPLMKRWPLRNPEVFEAGGLQTNVTAWDMLSQQNRLSDGQMAWVAKGVDIKEFIIPYEGVFKGQHISSAYPPPRREANYPSIATSVDFVRSAIQSRI